MFEALQTAGAAWRTIAHISEWSGLSIGALAVAGVVFFYVPLARKFMIAAAVTIVVGWLCLIHGDRVGRADVEAQWADARKAAIAAEQERDTMAEQKLAAKYGPQLAALQKQAAERKTWSDDYERQILALRAKAGAAGKPAAARCELGDRALRVRRK
jgi:hypothetical protein